MAFVKRTHAPRFSFMVATLIVRLLPSALVLVAAACGGSSEAKSPAKRSEEVPANSLSDARLRGADGEEPAHAQASDPTQPYTTSVTPTADEKPAKGSDKVGKGRVARPECERMFDRYLELELAGSAQLKDLPPELIEQAKQAAREKHGEAPCDATRAQYDCAMRATTTSAWQRCLK